MFLLYKKKISFGSAFILFVSLLLQSFLMFDIPEAHASCGAMPSVSTVLPSNVNVGEDFIFTVTFDNSVANGYGPFIDIIFPQGVDVDDGITFNSASILGSNVTAISQYSTGSLDHPYAVDSAGNPISVAVTSGDTLVTLQLPFGSIVPGQATTYDISATLSGYADVPTSLSIQARPGFQYGCDALENPSVDASIVGSFSSTSLSPSIFSVTKEYIGPEQETATGPNYPRQYRLSVDIADGETISNLIVEDFLPPEVAYLSVVSTTPASVLISEPLTGAAQLSPNNRLAVDFSSVLGGPGDTDAEVIVEYFVPQFDATSGFIISSGAGAPNVVSNSVSASGDWTPSDSRDVVSVVSDTDSVDFSAEPLVIQKSVSNITSVQNTPGDTVEYTLNFQISDYFGVTGIIVSDTIGDGLRFATGFSPTLSVTDRNGTTAGTVLVSDYTIDNSNIGGDTNTITDGSQIVTFDISSAMINLGSSGGYLLGGYTTGGSLLSTGAGTLTYRAIIQDEFTDTYLPADESVDVGDLLTNSVVISGSLIDINTLAPYGSIAVNTGSASLEIEGSDFDKDIYALNGIPLTSTGVIQINPGDNVTYRLTYDVPTADIENLTLTDFLPSPIYSISGFSTTFYTSGGIPPAGFVGYGPSDTLSTLTSPSVGTVPTVLVNTGSNSFTLNYGSFDDPLNRAATIEVLFTVTATNEPFADGLFLTNLANSSQGTTNQGTLEGGSIIQVILGQPQIDISKGVVSSDNAGATFTPSTVGPVAFSAPGSSCPRYAPVVSSSGISSSPINSNISNVNGGDLVTYAIVVENQGSSTRGAFDIVVKDLMATGLVVPSSGLNLCVTRGDGLALSFTDVDDLPTSGTSLFGSGIKVVDLSPTTGALAAYTGSLGDNILLITYDLEVEETLEPSGTYKNTAIVTNFASTESGVDFAVEELIRDDASLTIEEPVIDKNRIGTNLPYTAGNTVVVGEQVQYSVEFSVPESTSFSGVMLSDLLDNGLVFVSMDSIVASGSLSSSSGTFASILTSAVITSAGRQLDINFGDITNTDTDDTTDETIVLTYTTAVANIGAANDGVTRNNRADIIWNVDGGTNFDRNRAGNVTIREPQLALTKSGPVSNSDSGRVVTYQLSISHTGSNIVDAFDVVLTDNILATDLAYVTGSYQLVSGVAPTTVSTGGTLEFTYDVIPQGSSSTISFDAILHTGILDNTTINNTADLFWSSMSGDNFVSQSPYVSTAVERNGSGGVNSYTISDNAMVLFTFSLTGSKSVVSTNQSHTVGQNVAIGEDVQYEIVFEVPEETAFSGAQIVDTFDTGLSFVSFDSISASGLITSSLGPIASIIPTTGVGTLTFDFGTLSNPDTNTGTIETIRVLYTVNVDNITGNVQGTSLNNSATTQWSGGSYTVQSSDVIVVEPSLSLQKTAPATNTGSQRDITYNFVISHDGFSLADAFNVDFSDTLPSGMDFVSGSFLSGFAPSSTSFGTSTVVSYDTLPLGAVSEFQIQARLDSSFISDTSITNTGLVIWSSLSGSVAGERTATGGINDHFTAGGATTLFTFNLDVSKNIADTSEIATTGTNVAVGESILYEIVIEVPDDSGFSGVIVTDVLETGLIYDSYVPTIASGSLVSSQGLFTSIVPTVSGQDITWNLGLLTNSDTDYPSQETVLLRYYAKADNSTIVQNGTGLTNLINVNRSGGTGVTDSIVVTVVEPSIDITKSVSGSNVDSSRTMTYTIRVEHNGFSTSDAFDVLINDPLSSIQMFYVTGSLVQISGSPATLVSTSGGLQVGIAHLPLGQSSEFMFDARLENSVATPAIVMNTGFATWTSLSGVVTGERTGIGGTNDYTDDDTATVLFTTTGAISKGVFGTSLASTTGTDVAVGELVQYKIIIEVDNDSSLVSTTVGDQLGTGLTYVQTDSITSSGTVNTSVGSFNSVTPSVVGQDITWSFGTVSNSDLNTGTVETFEIIYTARVDNISGNQDSISLLNLANVIWSDGSGFTMAPTLTVVEPVLQINKSASTGVLQSDRTIDYTITISHDPSSTSDAYDIVFTDALSGLNLQATGTVNWISGPIGSATVTSGDLTVLIDHLPLGQSSQFEFTTFLDFVVTGNTVITNTGEVFWTSVSGTIMGERTGTGLVNNYASSGADSVIAEFVDLSVVKSVNASSTVTPNTLVDFTIAVSNDGFTGATNVVVEDVLPLGLIYGSSSATQGSYDDTLGQWTVGTLATGQTETLTISVSSSTVGTYINSAEVLAVDQPDIDSIPNNTVIAEDDRDEAVVVYGTVSTPGGGGGGGGGGGLTPDDCPDINGDGVNDYLDDLSPSRYDNTCELTVLPIEEPSAPEEPETDEPEENLDEQDTLVDFDYPITTRVQNPLRFGEIDPTFLLPTKLMQTGTPVEALLKKGVAVKKHPVILTDQYDWIVSHDASTAPRNIDYWLSVLPYEQDKNADRYVVVPRHGIISPITSVSKDNIAYDQLVSGREIEINQFMERGVLHYPESAGAAEIGNMVVAGHSSYFTNASGDYKTVFTSLPLVENGEIVRVYEKNEQGDYDLYEYIVNASYETSPYDTEILLPKKGSTLTMFTCTPIGGIANRWIVEAHLNVPEYIQEESFVTYQISKKLKDRIDDVMEELKKKGLAVRKQIKRTITPKLRLLRLKDPGLEGLTYYLEMKINELVD